MVARGHEILPEPSSAFPRPTITGLLATLTILLILAAFPPNAESQATGPGQGTGQDCEEIKGDIKDLQDLIAQLSVEMQRLTDQLSQLGNDIAKAQANFKKDSRVFAFAGEAIRGQFLDAIAKMLNLRTQLKQQLEDDANLMQAIKDEIADLLSKLGNCAPPSTTQPPNQENANPQLPPNTPPQKNKSVSMSGLTPTIRLSGFGGASFINGNTPATAGFDGAVLFPLGNRVLVGPTAGFQWVGTSIVSTIGGGPPPSTFINTSVGFKQGNFGGQVGYNLSGWELGIRGGATVAGSTITQNEGFCDPTAGCTVSSTTTTHDTVVGPFVGGYISHSIFSHVGVFAEFDYHRLKDNNVLDVSDRSVVGGLVLSFGRHEAK